MAKDKNFEYLGQAFQIQLLNQIIVDKEFSHAIIDVMEPSYFENKYFKIIIQMIKEYYVKYEHTPSFDTLEQIESGQNSGQSSANNSARNTIVVVTNTCPQPLGSAEVEMPTTPTEV